MSHRKFWWNCKHMRSPLGVAICKKKDSAYEPVYCDKSRCKEIETRK